MPEGRTGGNAAGGRESRPARPRMASAGGNPWPGGRRRAVVAFVALAAPRLTRRLAGDSHLRTIALLALLLLPETAFGAGSRSGAFAAVPPVLCAGDTVELSWQPPAGARELELLLVPASGSRTLFRVTAEIEPAIRSVRWRVPALPCEGARLLLRWGDAHGEYEGPASTPFRIVARPRGADVGATAAALVHEGACPGDVPPRAAPRGLDDGPRLDMTVSALPVLDSRARPAAPARDPRPIPAAAARDVRAAAVARSCVPEAVPRRN